ncbi:MAG: putative DNA modification/repair radical SAM protein [Dehalococcoidia bacterium]|nr:putative DNA modification/repair radical SAM protein [Dehalococcoidia bacterium]
MRTTHKLDLLVNAAQFDTCGYSSPRQKDTNSPLKYIYRAALPEGGSVCLFKVLLTNVCVNDCAYCVNQCGRDIPRSTFQPDELAGTFMELHQRRLAQGLFLSSGIGVNPNQTMEAMIKTVQILRSRHEYKGYVHLKILPGAKFDCVEEACRVANRVSLNMEAPTAHHMVKLSHKKDLFNDIVERMRWVKQLMVKDNKLVPSGQTTQFVVGAADEDDRDILRTTDALYHEIGLRRAYFSAFQPVSRSRLEGHPPTPLIREHRLYQVDWLLRVYGFPLREVELALDETDNLPLKKDPKLLIAQRQPWLFPVDVNTAGRDDLLRVPGIGPVSTDRIIRTRRDSRIDSLTQMQKMGVVTKRAAKYIWFQGMLEYEKQLAFLPEAEEEANTVNSLAVVLL